MSNGGAHTNFDGHAFGAGAAGAATVLAAAAVAGFANLAAQREADWDAWSRSQLEEAANCEHRLRVGYQRRAEEAEAHNTQLRAVVALLTARLRR